MKGQAGFTLIELLVVLGIIGTLLGIATLYFAHLNDKYQVESLTKELYSTLMRTRNNAATGKIQWIINVNANGIQYGPDANGDGLIDMAPPPDVPSPRFAIHTTTNISGLAANTIVFDRLGVMANQDAMGNAPIITLDIRGYSANANPAMDCVVIAATRINIGKMNAGGNNCDRR